LGANIGAIYRIVPDSYGRGRIAAQDHTQMAFVVQGELSAILTTQAGQVLDTVYVCREIEFDAPAPFNDVNAINVINGIVKAGTFPRGAKPTKEISASQNYGFALQIMHRPNDRKLDLRECRYAQDLSEWIEEKLGDATTTLPADTIYKNFMGINGPAGVNYGLSKRMVQMYLLCLVREGRLRISLSGRNLPVEVIDYSNIAGIDFKVAVLEAFHQVQRLKPPAGWETLAPFAAVLLDDPSLSTVHEDADIQGAIQRLIAFKSEQLKPFQGFLVELADLFSEIQQPNPLSERLSAWEKFLKSPVDIADPIPYLRNGLEKAFGYKIYQEDQVEQADVDDLATRKAEIEQARKLLQYGERLRAAYRYAHTALPDDGAQDRALALNSIRSALDLVRLRLDSLIELMSNESRLLSELLEPAAEVIQSYSVRYLQAFDQVVSATEGARLSIQGLTSHPQYLTLARLEQVPQLASGASQALHRRFMEAVECPDLFPAHVTRGLVERELARWPQPAASPLTMQNAADWMAAANRCLQDCQSALQTALQDKATLLYSEALRSRLAQGKGEPFIDALLNAESPQSLAKILVEQLSKSLDSDVESKLELLRRYLQHIIVRKVHLSEFKPGKHTLEKSDLPRIVEEFERFLSDQFSTSSKDELPVIEIEP
jgi:hypothetical protein